MTTQLSEHITTEHTEMAEVLVKIVRDKHLWLEQRQQSQPLASFKHLLKPSDRSFYDALKHRKSSVYSRMQKSIAFQRADPRRI